MTPFQDKLARKVITELSSGGYVLESRSDAGEWNVYRTSDGTAVTAHVMRILFDNGIATPSGDGLFGDSQTIALTPRAMDQAEFFRERFGPGWIKAKAGSKAALGATGRAVKKSELDEAKAIFQLIEFARKGAERMPA